MGRGYTQDIKIPMVKEEIGKYLKKIQLKNGNTSKLIERRPKRKHPTDLATEIK